MVIEMVSEKATVIAKNNVGKYFQCAAILALHLKGIETPSERI